MKRVKKKKKQPKFKLNKFYQSDLKKKSMDFFYSFKSGS